MGSNHRVNIELGADLQQEYEYWLEVKKSLCIERSINSFLNYIHHYGTHNNPRNPDDAD